MNEIRAVVYGVGAMGSLATRLLLERGVQIVGAIARSPDKVGKDLGEVAGLGKTLDILVESDARTVLARGADIAVVCVSSYLNTMRDHFATCLESGVNVVTIEEETVFPWHTSPELASQLDTLARENGVSLAASGAQDVFWLHLVSTLLGASHHIESVEGHCCWNVDDYGPEVAQHVRVGEMADAFQQYVAKHGWPEFVARNTLEALVSRLGLSVKSITSSVKPVVADKSTTCHCLGIEISPGKLLGTIDTTLLETEEGPRFSFSMEGRVYLPGETDLNEWFIHGEPNLQLRNDAVPTRFITCSSMINRIPDIICAAPGLISLDQLGEPRYRHGNLSIHLDK